MNNQQQPPKQQQTVTSSSPKNNDVPPTRSPASNNHTPPGSVQAHVSPAGQIVSKYIILNEARRAGSDGSMSTSASAGPWFDPRQGSKFSFENFQPRG